MKIKDGLLTAPKLYRAAWIYRLSPLLACSGVVAFLLVVTLFSLSGSSSPNTASAVFWIILGAVFLLILGGLLCLLTLGTCIFTSPEGLLYRSMGTCVYTPWKNIDGVETKVMGAFNIENLRLHWEAIVEMSLDEGIKEQIAVITKVSAVRATERSLPVLRFLVFLLAFVSLFTGGHARSMTRVRNPSLSKYIPVGLFGGDWKMGNLGAEVARYRNLVGQEQNKTHQAKE